MDRWDFNRFEYCSYAGIAFCQKYMDMEQELIFESAESRYNTVERLYDNISDFKDLVSVEKDFFEKLYDHSKDTKKADEKEVADYQDKINALNTDIEKWSKVRKGMLIAEGVEGVFVTISLAFGPFGILAAIIVGAGMIAEGITAITADEKIKEGTKQLAEYQKTMQSYSQDAAVLKDLITRLNNICLFLDKTGKALESICGAWEQIRSNISEIRSTFDQMEQQEQQALYVQLQDSLVMESPKMKELQELAEALELKKQLK